jgi:hypothetical protein
MADLTPEEKKAQDDAARVRALMAGIFRDLKVEDLMKIAAGFKEMGEKAVKSSEEMSKISDELENISKKSLGIKSREEIKSAMSSIEALEIAMGKNISAITKANINKMKFELEIDAAKNLQLEMQQKNFLGSIGGAMKAQQVKVLQGMEAVFGTQVASMFMKVAGPIGIGIAVFTGITMALQALFNTAQTGFKSFGTSWASAGGMIGNSVKDYIHMTAEVSKGFNDITQVGYTTRQASDLVKKSMTEMSWALGVTAIRTEGFMGSLSESSIKAMNRTTELVLEMGRMSTAIFGSTEQTSKFVTVANLFNLQTTESIKIFGTGIGKMAGKLHLDINIMLDSINNMGKTMMGTGVNGIDRLTSSFIPLIKQISNFGKAGELSVYETQELLKGVETLSKGVDTFTYMAAAGMGNLESAYEGALGVDPASRAKTIIDRFSNLTPAMASIAVKQMGLFGEMPEAMRIKMVEAFRKMTPEQIKGKTPTDIAREVLGVKPGEEDVQSQIAAGILAGQDIQGQMLDALIKILRVVTNGVLGFLTGNKNREAREEIMRLTETKQSATITGTSQYSQTSISNAMGR